MTEYRGPNTHRFIYGQLSDISESEQLAVSSADVCQTGNEVYRHAERHRHLKSLRLESCTGCGTASLLYAIFVCPRMNSLGT